jgi:hypothetical protein
MRTEDAMLNAGESVLREAGVESDPRMLALNVWCAMCLAVPSAKPGRPPKNPEALAKARKEREAGAPVSKLVKKYGLSGSYAQKLRKIKPNAADRGKL